MPEPTLHHLGYVVRNIAPAIERFVAEGATVLIGATVDPIQKVSCALLRLAEGVDVELVAPLDPDDSPVTGRLRRGGGLDHVCLSVDDVATALATEVDRDAVVVCPPVYAVTFDRTVAFAHRRSGLLVELMGREDDDQSTRSV
jgi:methylmalonyl-CoA/ethylmalonyl-CoA epimerase